MRLVPMSCVVVLSLFSACGCTQQPAANVGDGQGDGGDSKVRIEIPVGMMVGTIDLVAGEEATYRSVYAFPASMGPFEDVTVDLAATLETVSVTPTDTTGTKSTVSMQSATTTVSYRIGPMEDMDTVCETGVEYGPFVVASDELAQPTSIDPTSTTVSSDTLAVINTGQFSVCVTGTANVDATMTIGTVVTDVTMPSDSGTGTGDDGSTGGSGDGCVGCNCACGFGNDAPEGEKPAALCGIMFPSSEIPGSSFLECSSDAQCDDDNECTRDECVGVVVKVCESTPIAGCAGPEIVRNGDFIVFEFDHRIESLTVNGLPADLETESWTATGLEPGSQTLLIEWNNRSVANPPTGCQVVDVVVVQ